MKNSNQEQEQTELKLQTELDTADHGETVTECDQQSSDMEYVSETEVQMNEKQELLSAYEKPAMVEPSLNDGSEEAKEKYRIVPFDIEEFSDEYNELITDIKFKGKFAGAEYLSNEQKDTLWYELQTDYTIKFNEMCNGIKYNLFLTSDEMNLLYDVFTKHVEYDCDFVFYGKLIEDKIEEIKHKYINTNNKEASALNMNFNQVQAFVHLLKTYKWKGLGVKGNHIYNIMIKIMNITAVRDYFRSLSDRNSGELVSFVREISAVNEQSNPSNPTATDFLTEGENHSE